MARRLLIQRRRRKREVSIFARLTSAHSAVVMLLRRALLRTCGGGKRRQRWEATAGSSSGWSIFDASATKAASFAQSAVVCSVMFGHGTPRAYFIGLSLGPSVGSEGKRLGSDLVRLGRHATWATCMEASKREPEKERCMTVAARVGRFTNPHDRPPLASLGCPVVCDGTPSEGGHSIEGVHVRALDSGDVLTQVDSCMGAGGRTVA
nr:hypothetical protein Iba_chr15aCG14360 [Ipomoea batatas]